MNSRMFCWTIYILAVVSMFEAEACSSGMEYNEEFDSCYKRVTIPMTWDDAQAHCRCSTAGGHLIEVTSEAKQKFVQDQMDGAHAWLGGRRLRNGGVNDFEWSYSGASLDSYENWNVNQPDNINYDTSVSNPDCIIGLGDHSYQWYDRSCAFEAEFICEKQSPQGMEYNINFDACYKIVTDAKSWDDAQSYCERLGPGTHLIEINSQEKQNYMAEVMAGSHTWLGGRRIPEGGVDDFQWSFSRKPLNYANWNSKQPDNINYDKSIPDPDCIIALQDHDHEWYDRACVFEAAFICESYV